jgi:hypothetical protein
MQNLLKTRNFIFKQINIDSFGDLDNFRSN